jgi:hypothetical protein
MTPMAPLVAPQKQAGGRMAPSTSHPDQPRASSIQNNSGLPQGLAGWRAAG